MDAVEVPAHEKGEKRWMLWIGRVVSLWPAFVILTSATWKLTRSPGYVAEFGRIGWPESALTGLALLQLSCLVLYLIPQLQFWARCCSPATWAGRLPRTFVLVSLIRCSSRYPRA
jgi:hypothetical protein